MMRKLGIIGAMKEEVALLQESWSGLPSPAGREWIFGMAYFAACR